MIIDSLSFKTFEHQSYLTNKLPVPNNISNIWNFGRCLGLFLVLQIISGLLLASHYSADTSLAFDRITALSREVSWGWLLRIAHLNIASFFFLFLYIHICRGIYYESYNYSKLWLRGFSIFILSILIAFLGYVLPWGQMRFWGATVITNLISSIPLIGERIVRWVWGGFGVSKATLTRFFMIHFCGPFLLLSLVVLHIFLLHKTGRQNPSNIRSKYNVLSFHPFYTLKDLLTFFTLFIILEIFIFLIPFVLGDPENFSVANIISTPEHIVPEWYFLFAYAILRCIPRKGLGVVGIFLSVSIILLPLCTIRLHSKTLGFGRGFWWVKQQFLWSLLIILFLLTWLGSQVVSAPFVALSQVIFSFFLIINIMIRWKSRV